MKIKKNSQIIATINSVSELENFVKENIDTSLFSFTDKLVCMSIELLKKEKIGIKLFRKIYCQTVNGGFSKFSKIFWINRGWSEIDTISKIKDLQKKNSNKKTEKLKTRQKLNDNSWKTEFNTTPEYFVKKFGVNMIEAQKMLTERQKTFSLDKCIKKYGEVDGQLVFKDRQDKWIHTLSLKSPEEKMQINCKRNVTLGKASKESLKIFNPLRKFLLSTGLFHDDEIYLGVDDKKEWFLSSFDKFYSYDFCVPKLKLIIEFQGHAWHPDHRLTEEELKSWKSVQGVSGTEVSAKDKAKYDFAIANGFTILYLWSKDSLSKNVKIAFDVITSKIKETTFDVKITTIDKLLKDNIVYANSPVGYQPITNFLDQGIKQCYDVTFENGKKLRCSNDHMIRLFNGDWIKIEQIVNDMQLLDSTEFQTNSGDSKILNIKNTGDQHVYDLSIGHDDHSYYTNGVVSHNCGKTLLSVAAGLELVLEKKKYDRLVITRPVQAVGKDIGFLPGTKEEKMEPWIAPIRDNLNYLFKSAGKKFQKVSKDNEGTKTFKSDPYIDMLFEKGIIEIEAVTYMRGRSIPNSFIIIDEAQNLSIHELKTIITRVGDNTKIVLTGDIEQIDNTHVDIFTNGLTYAVEKFKDYAIAGHVTLVKGERSALASLASQIL